MRLVLYCMYYNPNVEKKEKLQKIIIIIMRLVHLFDLEHLSLFSTMTEEIDSIIRDFIAQHG